MKQKILSPTTGGLKLSMVILPIIIGIAFICAGCQRDDVLPVTKGIVGKWQLIQYPETCVGFGDIQLEITNDSVFKRYTNSELTLESTFTIKTGIMGYDTIFFHNPDIDFSYQFISLLGNDTLHLDAPILTSIQICNYFKRKK